MDNVKKLKQLKKFEASLKDKNLEELKKLEQKIIKEAEKIDKEVAEMEFDLPKENYEVVAKAIRDLLNKKTVQWQLTLGLVVLYEFWDPEKYTEKIKYPVIDGTLRTLGEESFTGYNEWAAVVAINKYFEQLRDKYIDATEKVYDIASKHNAVIDAINKNTPIGTVEE